MKKLLWLWPALLVLCLYYWAVEVFQEHRWVLLAGVVIGAAIGAAMA